MAYAEKRGNLWRARWRGPDGTLESRPGFHKRKAAENYGRDQEAAIRANTYVDPRAGKITLTEWVNQWYPALDLEPTTLSNYRYQIEVHILPTFGNRALASITAEEVSAWERQIAASGYSRRTARDARSTLTTVLGDAIPRYIQANPAQRRRGKGRKGQRRIQRIEQAGKAWATPIQALLVAERCAALSGSDTDFVMIITVAYTGMRWSEVIGLGPECLQDDHVDVSWKLYELNGHFYRGRPKDGSIRPADLPPFLAGMLANQVSVPTQKCSCRNTEKPWCRAVATSSSAPSTATSAGPTTANGSSGPLLTAPTQSAASGQRCRSWWTSTPRTRDGRYRHGRWPCPARNSSHRSAEASPAWSATPRPAGVPCVGAHGCGDWTVTSFRIALAAPAATDRDNRLPATWPWRRGCRCSLA
jgi:hypothetical protein